jgi:wobble nucleotide-excising tRNase
MLKEISIARVATYGEDSQRLDDLREINFLFGTNGSGKTTISRVIANPSSYADCAVNWRDARALEPLVYNCDFVEQNFTPQLCGIFTLGKVEADTLKKIEKARAKVADIEAEIGRLKGTLGAVDNSSGKRAELCNLRNVFEDQCWAIKSTHDPHFEGAFLGMRGSRKKFCDKVLEEADSNHADIHPVEDLKVRARTVLAEGVTKLPAVPTIEVENLLGIEKEPVLAKRVVGKEDIDIGALIRRLSNSDWVRQGLRYAEGPGTPCPFCQKPLNEQLLAKLNAFFDETYLSDIEAIARTEEAYSTFAAAILTKIDDVLASGYPHIDVEKLRPFCDQVRTLIILNTAHIQRKRKEPSTPVKLEPLAEHLRAVAAIIEQANSEITKHNMLVDNLTAERKTLTSEIWKCLTEEYKDPIRKYMTSKRDIDKAIEVISATIDTKTQTLTAAQATLADLEKQVTSIQPTVTEINATLASFGFTNFRLATAGDKQQFYAIVRADGSDARETLSEGERSFTAFLYFYHLIRGSTSASGINADRIVVFDDPVSSLDSDVLFIVCALIKRVLAEAKDGKGRVKQVFVLTHNIYFHKEVSFDPKRQQGQRLKHETFWIVRKAGPTTIIEGHKKNPIRTSYEMLWAGVKNQNRSKLTIQNVLRRILEHYFTILGNIDKDTLIAKFEGRDQQICASLFSWINDGSHNFTDDLYVVADDTTVTQYLLVFEQIFRSTNHGAHYDMMMGSETTPATD